MDAAEALADLVEISSQVDAAVVLGEDGEPQASIPAGERGSSLARAARDLLAAAADAGPVSGGRSVTAVHAATRAGSLFVVREGGRTIAAVTGPAPTAGLVLYDVRTALAALDGLAAESAAAAAGGGAGS